MTAIRNTLAGALLLVIVHLLPVWLPRWRPTVRGSTSTAAGVAAPRGAASEIYWG